MKPALVASLVLMPLLSMPVAAADDTWMREQLRQSTIAVRQLQDENSALKAQLAGAAKPVAEAKPSRAEINRVRAEAERAAQAARVPLEQELVLLKQQLQQAQMQLSAQEEERRRLAAAAGESAQCRTDNAELVAVSEELLAKYRDQGVWAALWQAEPVTGIPRARREALLEKYRAGIADGTFAGMGAAQVDTAAPGAMP